MNAQLEKDLMTMRRLISLEANDAIGLASRVNAIIDTLSGSTMNVLDSASVTLGNFVNLSSVQRDFISKVSKVNYADVAVINISKPVGLKVTYIEYLDTYLIPGVHYCDDVIKSLDKFTAFIGRIVNNREDRISLNDMYDGTSAIAEERYMSLTEINTARQNCITVGSTDADGRVSELVLNNSQWRDILNKQAIVEKQMQKIAPKLVDSKVRKAVTYLKTLKDESARGNMSDISPEMLMRLADYIEATAKSVEFYAMIYHDVMAFTTALKDDISKIKMIMSA